MASPRTRKVLKDLRSTDENNLCFECGTHSPQWVSVSYGVWICLECSGKHRGLGVHLSFVRSVTMDKWKDLELEKMKVGGNKKARLFFESQDDYHDFMSIQEKYNTRAAALYRDKISTEAQGQPWSIETSSARNYVSHQVTSKLSSSVSYPRFEGGDDKASNGAYNGSGGYHGSGVGMTNVHSYTVSSGASMEETLGYDKETLSKHKEDFFSRKQTENANRPDHLPPSQGGKYVGFGSSANQQKKDSDYWSTLSEGWSSFTLGASKLASQATEKASTLAVSASQKTKEIGSIVNEKMKDKNLLNEVSQSVTGLASKIQVAGMKGFSSIFGDQHQQQQQSANNGLNKQTSLQHNKSSYGSTYDQGSYQSYVGGDGEVDGNDGDDEKNGWDTKETTWKDADDWNGAEGAYQPQKQNKKHSSNKQMEQEIGGWEDFEQTNDELSGTKTTTMTTKKKIYPKTNKVSTDLIDFNELEVKNSKGKVKDDSGWDDDAWNSLN